MYDNGKDIFVPSKEMLENTHDLDWLIDYFDKYEKGVDLRVDI